MSRKTFKKTITCPGCLERREVYYYQTQLMYCERCKHRAEEFRHKRDPAARKETDKDLERIDQKLSKLVELEHAMPWEKHGQQP